MFAPSYLITFFAALSLTIYAADQEIDHDEEMVNLDEEPLIEIGQNQKINLWDNLPPELFILVSMHTEPATWKNLNLCCKKFAELSKTTWLGNISPTMDTNRYYEALDNLAPYIRSLPPDKNLEMVAKIHQHIRKMLKQSSDHQFSLLFHLKSGKKKVNKLAALVDQPPVRSNHLISLSRSCYRDPIWRTIIIMSDISALALVCYYTYDFFTINDQRYTHWQEQFARNLNLTMSDDYFSHNLSYYDARYKCQITIDSADVIDRSSFYHMLGCVTQNGTRLSAYSFDFVCKNLVSLHNDTIAACSKGLSTMVNESYQLFMHSTDEASNKSRSIFGNICYKIPDQASWLTFFTEPGLFTDWQDECPNVSSAEQGYIMNYVSFYTYNASKMAMALTDPRSLYINYFLSLYLTIGLALTTYLTYFSLCS